MMCVSFALLKENQRTSTAIKSKVTKLSLEINQSSEVGCLFGSYTVPR